MNGIWWERLLEFWYCYWLLTVYWYWYFGCDNSSSFHTDNQKNNISVWDEGLPDDIDGSVGAAEKKYY